MSRALIEIVLFLTPFIAYAIYLMATQHDVREREHWRRNVLAGLAIAGCFFVIASLIVFAHFGGAPPGSIYTPARPGPGGTIIPGQLK